jgi:hypothetical protein
MGKILDGGFDVTEATAILLAGNSEKKMKKVYFHPHLNGETPELKYRALMPHQQMSMTVETNAEDCLN